MEKRIQFLVKDLDTQTRRVKFAFSKFDEYDADEDITLKGAFAKTIKEQGPIGADRIKHLWNHERKMLPPIGKVEEMWEDNEYAYASSRLLKGDLPNLILEGYQEETIKEHSYWGKGIVVGKNDRGGHIIKEVALREVSTVIWGAQEKAKLVELGKGEFTQKSDLSTIEDFEKYLQDLAKWVSKSKATDEIIQDIETEILKSAELLETLKLDGRHRETPEKFEPLSLADMYKLLR